MREAVTMIVAVALIFVLAVLSLVAWSLTRIVHKTGGTLVIESKAVAILFKIFFRIEYHSPGRAGWLANIAEHSYPGQDPINTADDAFTTDAKPLTGGDDSS